MPQETGLGVMSDGGLSCVAGPELGHSWVIVGSSGDGFPMVSRSEKDLQTEGSPHLMRI